MNKCILCGLCVRTCDEVMGVGALGLVSRGFDTEVKPALEQGLEETSCISCGQCVSLCPTGALQEKTNLKKNVPLQKETTVTTCSYCSVGCKIELKTYGNLLIKSEPNKEGHVNEGLICGRGKWAFDSAIDDDRLKKPYIKINGKLEECKYSRTGYRFKGWSQGLDSRLYKSGEAFMPYDRTVTLYAKWEAVESNNIKIVDQPVDKTVEEGMTTSFTVKAEGEGLSYQWQYKQAGSTTWSDWSGQTKTTLKVGYLEKRNGMSFRCIVKDASGYKTISNEALLIYNQKVQTTFSKTSGNVTFKVQYPENITCGMPTTFKLSSEGTTDKVQYALYSLTTEDGTIVYDTSYGSNGKFFSKDSFDFTFYASGTYYIRFAIMDTGVSPYVWFNTGLYGIKLVIDDKGYPTVENVVADLKAQCGKTCTTDFEKAVWFNDWLVENCRYDSSYSYCAPEGALARGSGTCEAYHRAYVML